MFGHFEIVTPIRPNPNHHSSDVAMWGRNHPLIKYPIILIYFGFFF